MHSKRPASTDLLYNDESSELKIDSGKEDQPESKPTFTSPYAIVEAMQQLPENQQLIFLEQNKDQLRKLITREYIFRYVMNKLATILQKTFLFELVQDKLEKFVEDQPNDSLKALNLARSYHSIIRVLPKDSQRIFFLNMRTKLSTHVKANYGFILNVLKDIHEHDLKDMFFESVKDEFFQNFEYKPHPFGIVFQGLESINKKYSDSFFEAMTPRFASGAQYGLFSFDEVLSVLTDRSQREIFWDANAVAIPGFVKTKIEHNFVTSYTSTKQRHIKYKYKFTPGSEITSDYDFVLRMKAMSSTEEKIKFYEASKAKLISLNLIEYEFRQILEVLPTQETKDDFYNSLKAQVPGFAQEAIGKYTWRDLHKSNQVLFPYIPKQHSALPVTKSTEAKVETIVPKRR